MEIDKIDKSMATNVPKLWTIVHLNMNYIQYVN